jgi:outer membrane receptor for ferrienterochelin and colicins
MNKFYILFLAFSFLSAQNFSISGKIFDKNSNEALISANVYLKGTTLGANTDEKGFFQISNISKGQYILVIDYIGYKKVEEKIVLDKNIEKGFYLEKNSLFGESVVVTAGRQKQFLRDVPVMMNVANEFTFKTTQSVNLAEGLNFIPAVRVENNCQNCGFTQVRLNGLDGSYAQILINGRSLFSALNGVYGLEQIPESMIKQIEVVRGGGSSMYGSNAIAGIINVITTEPLSNEYSFDMNQALIDGLTSDRNLSFGSSFVTESRTMGLAFFGTLRNRDHWDANGDGFSEITYLDGKSLGTQIYYRPSNLSKLTFDYHFLYEDRRGGNKLNLKPHEADVAEATTHYVNGATFSYEQFLSSKSNQRIVTYFSAQNTKRDSYYGADNDPNAYGKTKERLYLGGLEYHFKLGNHSFVSGAEKKYSHLDDKSLAGYGIDQKINSFGFFLQDDFEINDIFTLSFGARIDRHNKIDKEIYSPRANLLINAIENLQFRASYARGFRAPQAFEEDLHIESVGGQKFHKSVLSKNLKPEISDSFSFSIDYSNEKKALPWGITLEGFYTLLDDVFVNEESHETENYVIYEKINGDGAKVYGSTLEFRYFFNRNFELQTGMTVQKSEYNKLTEVDGFLIREYFRTPNFYGFYLTKYSFSDHFSASLTGTLTGPMKVPHFAGYIAEDKIETTKTMLETNIKFEYELDVFGHENKFLLNAGVQNLFNVYQNDFDKTADRDPGYVYGPNRPRTYFLGINLEL